MNGDVVRQPRLADPGFAGHQKKAAAAGASVFHTGEQFGQFAFSPDKRALLSITDRSNLLQ